MAAACMMQDTSFWLNRRQVEEAECNYYAKLSGASPQSAAFSAGQSSLASQIAKAREQIQQSLNISETASGDNPVLARLVQVEEENRELRKVTNDLQAVVKSLEARIKALEIGSGKATAAAPAAAKPAAKKPAPPSSDSDDSDDDDDVDLFGSDDDETKAAAEKIKQERLAAYAAKKAKKPQVIAKSNVILDIKPWDDETDMAEMEQKVRTITMDGLLWGASKLVPVGYGIKKLQIATVIEDDKVSTEVLEEMICEFEDHVQSVDIAAFNKI